jgi:arylsulfatase A-like enzyme
VSLEEKSSKNLTRRDVLKRALYGGLGVAAAGAGAWWAWPRKRQPNMVLIVIDTLRRDALGCYGNSLGITPRIDEIAAEGVKFERTIASSSWTLPSIATLLTGTFPTIHGGQRIVEGDSKWQTPTIRKDVPTAAEIFKKNDFNNTFALANNVFTSPLLGLNRGFDVYDHKHAYSRSLRRSDENIDIALKTLRSRRNESNFVFLHLFDPHLYYDPPEGYKTKFTNGRSDPPPPLHRWMCQGMRRGKGKERKPPIPEDIDYIKGVYYGEINFVDVHIGRFVDALKRMGLYEQTTLVITADHGEEFWDHGWFEHGHTLYEELTRVPMIVKLPSAVPPAKQVIKSQVRHIDVIPTLFDLAGIEKPASFEGESLLPLIHARAKEDHRIAFCENTLYGPQTLSWSTGHYKCIYYMNSPEGKIWCRLYEWDSDPYEREDLVEKKPELVRNLHDALARFYNKLVSRTETMSEVVVKNLSPQAVKALKSLGYIR